MMRRLTDDDPAIVGPYRLIARIGQGGMGVVYLAESDSGDNTAVKALRADLGGDPSFVTRFRREVAACARVSGLCCAHFLDADADASPPWLATEYVAGPDLAEHVRRRGPLTGDMLVGTAAGIAEGIASIHAVGLVHRDLKPANVILSVDGPRVIDFGVAHHHDATSLTAVGTAIGSPGWMAPEQLRGDAIGPAADVWAWGATVAYAAIGRSPFGTGPAAEVAQRVLAGIANLDGIPEPLAGHVRAALTSDPDSRPSATCLAGTLAKSVAPDAITAVPGNTWHQPGGTAVLPPAARPHRRRWLVAAAICTLGALAATVAVLLATGDTTTSSRPPSTTTSGPAVASLTPQTTSTPVDQWAMSKFRPSKAEPAMSNTFRAFSDQPNPRTGVVRADIAGVRRQIGREVDGCGVHQADVHLVDDQRLVEVLPQELHPHRTRVAYPEVAHFATGLQIVVRGGDLLGLHQRIAAVHQQDVYVVS